MKNYFTGYSMEIENCKLKIMLLALLLSIFLPKAADAALILQHPNYTGLNSGLVGFWSFEAPAMAGNVAYDRSGQGNNGTLTNGPKPTIGKIGQALNFDGSDDYIKLSDNSPLSTVGDASFTLSAWVKGSNSTKAQQWIIARDNRSAQGGEDRRIISLALTHDSINEARFSIFDGLALTEALSTAGYTDGNWHHLVGIRNTQTDSVYLYVDGVLISSADDVTTASINTAGHPFYISEINDVDGLDAFVDGQIDDVRIYNRALSADEIKRLYKIGGTLKINQSLNSNSLNSGLVGHWTFDAANMAGNIAYDKSGQANNGTLTNGPTRKAGKLGQALNFDGVDDYVGATDNSTLDLDHHTISAWLRHSSDALTGWEAIVTKGDASYRMHLCGNCGQTFGAAINDGTDAVSSNTVPEPGRWYHVVATYDRVSLKIYVDGVLEGSDPATAAVVNVAHNFAIGENLQQTGRHWSGQIDDVRLYNRAITPDEIKRLYKMGSTFKINTDVASDNPDLKRGLVGYWSFDGNSMAGTRAHDMSGQGNHGTLTGGPTKVVGKLGQALSFDGTDDRIDIPNATNFALSSFTISAWAKKNGTNFDGIFSHNRLPLPADTHYHLRFENNGSIYCLAGDDDGSGYLVIVPVSGGTSGWHHLVCRFQSDALSAYADGVLLGTDTSGTYTPDTSDATEIGRIVRSGGSTFDWAKGSIDEVRVYNRALSADEIKRLYNMGTPR
jgi:hypothetical protein